MNIKKIKELAELMGENDLTEVEVEQEGIKVKLTKRAYGEIEHMVAPVMPTRVAQSAPQAEAAAPAQEASQNSNLKEIAAPMVGTFYTASAPDTDDYVKEGDTVKKGDVLCIVEAMKLMNEVKAEFACKIVEIVAKNAEAVEFGQAMFKVEPV